MKVSFSQYCSLYTFVSPIHGVRSQPGVQKLYLDIKGSSKRHRPYELIATRPLITVLPGLCRVYTVMDIDLLFTKNTTTQRHKQVSTFEGREKVNKRRGKIKRRDILRDQC